MSIKSALVKYCFSLYQQKIAQPYCAIIERMVIHNSRKLYMCMYLSKYMYIDNFPHVLLLSISKEVNSPMLPRIFYGSIQVVCTHFPLSHTSAIMV